MNNEITQMELDMPQLRQMVLENTQKINRNELIINKMRTEATEQACKVSEQNERLENFRKENDLYMRRSNERMDRLEKFAETHREVKEMLAETHREMKEMFSETNASIRRVSVEFLGVTGHIEEGLVSSSTEKIFKDAGFDLHDSGKKLRRELVSENKQMEVDALLGNEQLVVPVEVKANFTKKKVKRFLHKMEMLNAQLVRGTENVEKESNGNDSP